MSNGLTWLLVFGVATLLVRLGLSLVACGSARRTAAAATLGRAAVETAAATLAFWAVGAPLLLAAAGPVVGFDTGLIGFQSTESDRLAATEVYHWSLAVIGGAVVAGAVAERAKLRVGVVLSAVLGGVVFPVLGRWVWTGWLRQRDMADLGGATTVLLPAAVFAAVAAAAVGPRAGRYDGTKVGGEPLASHSWPAVCVGLGLTAVGWMPLLMGGLMVHTTPLNPVGPILLASAVLNAALAASGGLLAGVGYARVRRPRRGDRPTAFCGAVGLLGGLAAITAAPVAMGGTGAVLVGVLVGVVGPAFAAVLDRRAKLDDPAGMVSAVGVGSVVGTLAAGLFAVNSSAGFRRAVLVAVQSLGLATALTVSAAAAVLAVLLLRLAGPLRVDAEIERAGLDAVEMGLDHAE